MAGGFEVLSDEFQAILGSSPALVEIASGMAFCEGACYLPADDSFIWSDIPNNRILRWSERAGVTIFREPSGHANGNTVDRHGRVLSCETSGRRVTVTEPDGRTWTLVDAYAGQPLTSPNDVVVKSDGTVWFSDPDYGSLDPTIGHGQSPAQAQNRVYCLDPATGHLAAVAEEFDKPNGLAFSPDETRLYISDSGRTHGEERPHQVMVYDVIGGRRLANGRLFAVIDPWVPDGMRVDESGNLYVTAGDGVQVFAPDGRLLGKILTPEVAANCAFGGPDYATLVITATSSVWRIALTARGARRP